MTKKFEFDWQIPVPEPLLKGCVFDRWSEEKDSFSLEPKCIFKVDEYGFFIYWRSDGNDGDVIELCQVSDIRSGGLPKEQNTKLLNQLVKAHGENLEEKSLTICSGTDYININYQHVICPDAATAKEWKEGLRAITHNNKCNNVCVRTNLMKQVIEGAVEGKRTRGRPPLEYTKQIMADTNTRSYYDMKRMAENREKWRVAANSPGAAN